MQRRYMWGLDLSGSEQGAGGVGGLLAVRDVSGGTGVHFAGYDGNGNVAMLAKANDGTVSANYEYGPFGEVLRATGPMAKTNPFRFSTKSVDDGSDIVYYGCRYYCAATGRWLNRDPLQELAGANLCAFVDNDPVNTIDSIGLKIIVPCKLDELLKKHAVSGVEARSDPEPYTYFSQTVRYSLGDLYSEILGTLIRSSREFRFKSISDLELHVTARIQELNFARNLHGGFASRGSGVDIYFPTEFWNLERSGAGVNVPFIKKNLTPEQLREAYRALRDNPRVAMPCGEACKQSIYAGGVFAGYNVYPSTYNLREDKNIPDGDWVPGDWGSIQNTGTYIRGSGLEGENILYMGNQMYWGHFLDPSKYPSLNALNADRILPLKDWEKKVDDWDENINPSFQLEGWRRYTPAGLK